MSKETKVYTVEREFLAKYTVSEFVSRIVAAHLKRCEDMAREKR